MSKYFIFFICFSPLILSLYFPESKSKNIKQQGKFICTGNLISDSLTMKEKNDILTLDASFGNLNISKLNTRKTSAETLQTNLIIPDNEEKTVYLNGILKINGGVTYESENNENENLMNNQKGFSFIQMTNFFVNEVKQWRAINIDNNLNEINDKLNNEILSENSNSDTIEFKKVFYFDNFIEQLEKIEIELNFNYIEKIISNNQVTYIKIKDEYYWINNHNLEETQIDERNKLIQCSTKSTDHISIHINFSLIKEKKLEITFGTKITDKKLLKEKIKYCNKKMGNIISFSDLEILVR